MSEQEKLNKARNMYDKGEYSEARKLLEEITTKDAGIRINVLSAFIGVLDHVSENDKLLDVANEGIDVATKLGNDTMRNYFLGKKCFFLMSDLSSMIYRQKNLVLSAQVFKWIDFSLERDKKEYEALTETRKDLETEIDSTLEAVTKGAESSLDHNFRGHQFSTIGDAYSSKYLADKLDFQEGGKTKAKIANLYFVRRWNLDRYLYDRNIRKKIDESRDKCIQFFEKSIKEFKIAGMKSEEAHTIYNLAVKLRLFNRFRRAKKLLVEARVIAKSVEDGKRLIDKITKLEISVADKNRNIHDYVSEMGLDMP
jgi:cell division protein FtsB